MKTMKTDQLTKETKQLLIGIDKTEVEDKNGWWETYTGADFGGEMLEKILEIVKKSYKAGREEERERIVKIMKSTPYGDLSISTFIESVEKEL